MASESRRDAGSVARALLDHPEQFEFFQAVRIAHLMWPERAGVGSGVDPEEEAIRFRSHVDLAFPRAAVVELEGPDEERDTAEMKVAFMGLATPASFGSLPTHYTQEILELARDKSHAFNAFLDLFNHRWVSLFYRAWEKYRFALLFERGESSAFEEALFALIGMDTPGLRERLPFSDHALLYRAGLLSMAPVPGHVLASLVASYFGVEASCCQFEGKWCSIDPGDRSHLGFANASLGDDLVIGESVYLNQFRFRVRIGPMDWDTYCQHLPAGPGFPALQEFVRLTTGEEFDFDVQLVLRREEAPPLQLGGDPERPALLGWTMWCTSEPLGRDPDDAKFPSHQPPFPEALAGSALRTPPREEARP